MKYNLYLQSTQQKRLWERWAKEEGRSLAQFIRLAVAEKIVRMEKDLDK